MKGKRGPVSIGLPEFRAIVLSSLSKLGKSDTQKTALEEIKALLSNHANSEEKVLAFLNSLADTNEHLNNMHKKEFIKMYGTLAEVMEAEAVPYIPRMVTALQKKMKEGDQLLHEALGFAFGTLVHNTLHTITDLPASCDQLTFILKPLFANLLGANKVVQMGSALAFTKIIQHAPIECLQYLLGKLVGKILEITGNPSCKCQPQVLESVISLTLSVELDIAPYVPQLLPLGMQNMNSDDPNSRKSAIDLFYTFGAVVPNAVEPYAGEIVQLLSKCRTDKVKPVRDAAIETLGVYKDMRVEVEPVQDHAPPRTITAPPPDRRPVPIEPRPPSSRPESAKKVIKEESTPKQSKPKSSIFKGPINPNFFKAASSEAVVPYEGESGEDFAGVFHAPEGEMESSPEVFSKETAKFHEEPLVQSFKVTQRNIPPVTPPAEEQEEQKEDEPVSPPDGSAWQQTWNPQSEHPAQNLQQEVVELRAALEQLQHSTRTELSQVHERMNALEEMISTMSQLFEAKLKHALATARSNL